MDGHELPWQQFEQTAFVKQYIEELEFKAFQWIQFNLQDVHRKIDVGEIWI